MNVKKYHFLNVLFFLLFFSGTLLLGGCSSEPSYEHVIVISVDTLRADHLACYGNSEISTPTIDRLAREGVRFSNAFSPVPITLPAHTSLMTGKIPINHGIRNNSTFRLNDEETTLAEIFSKNAYKCAAFIGAFPLDSIFGLDQGFSLYSDNYPVRADSDSLFFPERRAAEVTAEAYQWMVENSENKTFVFIHLFDPHMPYSPPEPFDEEYSARSYDGEIAYCDKAIGDLMGALEKKGILDNTLIVLTADHGEDLGDHGEITHAFFTYDSTLHVPLIFWDSAGKIKTQTVIDGNVSLIDVAPTILELMNFDQLAPVDGQSLVKAMNKGKVDEVPLYFESLVPFLNYGWSPLQGIRYEGWKYIEAPIPELYNIAKDGKEKNNLYETDGNRARKMKELLAGYLEASSEKDDEKKSKIKLDGEIREQLLSLGYFTGGDNPSGAESELADPKTKLDQKNIITNLLVYYFEGNKDEALAEAEKQLKLSPDDLSLHQFIAFLKGGSESDVSSELVTSLKRILKEQTNNQAAMEMLLNNYGRSGQHQLALDIVKEYEKHSELSSNMARYAGLCCKALGRDDEAFVYLKSAVDKNEYALDARDELALWYAEKGAKEEALQLFEEIIRKDDNHLKARIDLGYFYLYDGKYMEAIKNFKVALKRDGSNSMANAGIGLAYAKSGYPAKGLPFLLVAQQQEPGKTELYYNIAMVFIQLQQKEKGAGYLSRFIELAGDGPVVEEAKALLKSLNP